MIASTGSSISVRREWPDFGARDDSLQKASGSLVINGISQMRALPMKKEFASLERYRLLGGPSDGSGSMAC